MTPCKASEGSTHEESARPWKKRPGGTVATGATKTLGSGKKKSAKTGGGGRIVNARLSREYCFCVHETCIRNDGSRLCPAERESSHLAGSSNWAVAAVIMLSAAALIIY
ncbi:hypothetical protein AVEN_247383-1 [Araneus ventricosus]|uniref:Uncharacterized protein n=1 Tax=Araneus ventricosus TaxID=182803 RepID=A0A4Y2V0U8_ARAVE|nr:hypothetical protein AVEN_247383-1 [Araneus ventricosus]